MSFTLLVLLAFQAVACAIVTFSPQDLALEMLNSIKDRGQAGLSTSGALGFIELGIFWQALAVATEPPSISPSNDALRPLLVDSLGSAIASLSNPETNADYPLDRFSIGSDIISWYLITRNDSFLPSIGAINASAALQPRNANNGLWYYNNPNNISAYQNLSYLDGMFSYAPYITYSTYLNNDIDPLPGLQAAVDQLEILNSICRQPSGLLVHGYDAIKTHAWADPQTGASPAVWGRSLAWYSLGLLNTLQAAEPSRELRRSKEFRRLRALFNSVMHAQIAAAERSKSATRKPGVWQVVDRPGEPGNFIEASSSFMTVYTVLRGVRLGFLDRSFARRHHSTAQNVACEIYETVKKDYLVRYDNGTLSLGGTSAIASLSGQDVDYEYYVSRPTVTDALVGTSAFVLASHEMGKLQHWA